MSRTISFAVAFALGAHCLATLLLAQRVTATWQGQQLGTALERLASTRQAPLWLDRRVDPRQTVDVQFTDVPFTQALAKLTEQHSLGTTQLDSVIYVGPKKTARGLATLARRARAALAQAPAAQRQQWLRAAPSSWPRLTQPRALLKELLAQAGVELVDDKLVAHDLWQARELPPLALVDRVVLILAGFDLTCEISPDGKTCRIVPIEYPLRASGDAPLAEASSPAPGTVARQQFSLQLENQPVGRVMEQLAGQLKLELFWNEDSLQADERSRETLVSCQVKNVDLDELLRRILGPAGLG
ncbi:MAG: hypothetical protein IH831_09195, partial [Planctomycetes bacterium]|nr:hypothetical protein [Planctomycetota bacterium]